jgi:hypothetical protein
MLITAPIAAPPAKTPNTITTERRAPSRTTSTSRTGRPYRYLVTSNAVTGI